MREWIGARRSDMVRRRRRQGIAVKKRVVTTPDSYMNDDGSIDDLFG